MKKLYLFLLSSAVAGSLFAQTTRTVLVEHYTQASCGPCATYNPAVKTLLNANPTKAIAIKYQTNWPGYDPMNLHNPTEISARVSYYTVNSVPHILLDGDRVGTGANEGHPVEFTQTALNTAQAITSPFSLSVTHTMSADYDSVYATVTVTAADNFSVIVPGNLKLRLAMVEEVIAFDSPPGTNGEKEFYNVMRKMLPNATGTALADSWTTSQSVVLNFAAPVPSYIYDKSQINLVAFIQDDTDKNVKQVAKSQPVAVQNDGGVASISNVPSITCTPTFTPSATIKNFGVATLTSGTINYQLNSGPIQNIPWTGSLAPGASTTVSLNSVTVPAGSHSLNVWLSNPNGVTDYNTANDMSSTLIHVATNTQTLPVQQDFVSATFPPANYIILNGDNAAGWERHTTGAGTSGSARMEFYDSPAGQVDEMVLPALNLSGITTGTHTLVFDVAYASYQGEADRLQVQVSTDCGSTWSDIYDKSGSTLQTAPSQLPAFVPSSTQWRHESISMNPYLGQAHLMVKFKATSAYGNNMYVDNINVRNVTSVEERMNTLSLNVYPNPAQDQVNIAFTTTANEMVSITLTDALGRIVLQQNGERTAGEQLVNVSTSELAAGAYMVTVSAGANQYTQKLYVVK